ncbi:hypothetical protein [Acinetobacter sp. G11]|uniref:hypothetical protein n=1 Tax=Acinetobacter sp. G11 TaxID=3415989 RepID=UPI003C7ABFBC
MSVEIDFSYAIDGFYHSVNYYRSEIPMNVGAMPAPTAVGITGITYTDLTAAAEKTYYVRFGVVRNGIEKISNEIVVSTANKYLININVVGGVIQDSGSLDFNWTEMNITKDDVNGILFGSYQSSLLADKVFNFNQNFKITFEFKRLSSVPKYSVFMAITSDAQWDGSLRRFAVGVGGVGGGDASIINKVFISRSRSGTANITASKTIDNNVWYTVEFSRNGNVFTLKVDDVVNTFTDTDATFNSIPMLIGTNLVNTADGQFNGYIRNFKAHDLTKV